MTPERWQQIEKLYHDSQERAPQERAIWLAEVCAGDEALRREVEKLLAANDDAGDFLNTPAFEMNTQQLTASSIMLPSGERFSHYEVLSKIGAGGMGEVYLARDTNLGRKVALKVLPLQFTADRGRLLRFIREAKTASALNHPNIITIYEIGQSGEIHFIATEFIEGVTLRQRLSNSKLDLREALEIARQIAAALDTAHRAGIIHRDIKPENIMLRPDGVVKVLDFGLAKLTESSAPIDFTAGQDLTTTAHGLLIGTPRYMSPEQARRQKVDARSDIFGFGVVVYEMIAGKPPFMGQTVADLFAALLSHDPTPLTHYVPTAPPELNYIVGKALAKDCAERYQTVRELQSDLQSLISNLGTSLPPLPVGDSTLLLTSAQSEANATGAAGKGMTNSTTSLSGRLTASLIRPTLKVSPLMIVVALIIFGGLLWYFLSRNRPAPLPRELRFETLFGKRGLGLATLKRSHFSPDGKKIAFAASGEGNNLWVKQVSGGQERQITFGPWREDSPIWSPDGEQLAFVSTRGNQLGIWTTPYLGDAPILRKTLGGSEAPTSAVWPALVAWSQDGTALYYEWNFQFYRLDLNSKEAAPLLPSNPPFQFPQDFALSPDQKEIAFIAQQNRQYDIWRLPLSGGTPQRITNNPTLEQAPLWRGNGKLLYNARVEGALQVYFVDVAGGVPTLLATGDHQCYLADYSAGTGRLLCQEQRDESDIFAVSTEGGAEQQVTNDLGAEFWASISPDSNSVLYHSIPGERFVWEPRKSLIFRKDLTAKEPVARLAADAFETQWSPDGERIAFLRLADSTTTQLWTVKASGGEEQRLTTSNVVSSGIRNSPPYNRIQPNSWCWSPDSKRLAYCAIQDGSVNLWTVAADGSQATPVSTNRDPDLRVDCPMWSPDGQRLAYVTETGRNGTPGTQTRSLWIAQQDKSSLIYHTTALLRFLGWTANNELVVAITDSVTGSRTQPTTAQIISLKFNGGDARIAQRQIGILDEAYLSNLHLAPNKRSVASVKSQNGRDDIWLFPLTNAPPRKLTNNSDPSVVFASLSWSSDGKTIYYDKQARWSLLTMIDRLD